MIAGFGIFRKATNQIFKDIPHLDVVDSLRVQIEFRKGLDYGEKAIILIHLRNLLAKIEAACFGKQNFLYVRRKSLNVADKVRGQVVCIVAEFRQCKAASIVKLEACHTA